MVNYPVENIKKSIEFLRSLGFNEYAVFGIIANWGKESGLRSNNLQNSYEIRLNFTDNSYVLAVDNGTYARQDFACDKAGFGLCQWTSGGRKLGLYDFVKSNYGSIADFDLQMRYFWQELNSGYKNVRDGLFKATSLDQATRLVMCKYERPANQSEENIQKRVAVAKELYDLYAIKNEEVEEMKLLKICFSAGHGLYTSGKRCMKKLDPTETREWVLNDRDARETEELLKDYYCEILRVDDVTGKTDISNTQRAKKSDQFGADVYIAFHHNAGINGKKTGYKGKPAGGIVVYHSNGSSERVKQATTLYNCLIAETGLTGDRAQTVIKKGFTEIKKCKAKSFLIENGFMDSPNDIDKILSVEHSKQTARAVVNFLVKEFGLKKKPTQTEEKPAEKTEDKKSEIPSLRGYKGFSIVDGLTSFGYQSSFSYRKKLAVLCGIVSNEKDYKGTSKQNSALLSYLKSH